MELNERFIDILEQGRKVDKRKFIWFCDHKVSVRIQTCFNNKPDEVMLCRISCYDRGNGYASRTLKTLTVLADKMKVTIRLYPSPFYLSLKEDAGLLSKKQLIGWYKSNGFKWKYFNGKQDFMVRKPK